MLRNQQSIEHHEWMKHQNILDNIDIKINILCDQILFNPSDETITITSCQLKDGQHNQSNNHQSSEQELDITNKKQNSFINCKSRVPKNDHCIEYVSDVICFGSTIVIFVLLFAVLIFFLAKDHENLFD